MKGFFMLAGTVLTELDLLQVSKLCESAGLKTSIEKDEFSVEDNATLTFREGFDHELVLVGDAVDLMSLKALAKQVSLILMRQGIAHAYELYDPTNELVFEFDSEA